MPITTTNSFIEESNIPPCCKLIGQKVYCGDVDCIVKLCYFRSNSGG